MDTVHFVNDLGVLTPRILRIPLFLGDTSAVVLELGLMLSTEKAGVLKSCKHLRGKNQIDPVRTDQAVL